MLLPLVLNKFNTTPAVEPRQEAGPPKSRDTDGDPLESDSEPRMPMPSTLFWSVRISLSGGLVLSGTDTDEASVEMRFESSVVTGGIGTCREYGVGPTPTLMIPAPLRTAT